MNKLKLTTACLVAVLAASSALAAPATKSGERRPAGETECTFDQGGKSEARKARKAAPMDCIVVKADPSQDGRAALRRSLERQAKEDLPRMELPSVKDLVNPKRTS